MGEAEGASVRGVDAGDEARKGGWVGAERLERRDGPLSLFSRRVLVTSGFGALTWEPTASQ